MIFLLKSNLCWLTSSKLHHWGHSRRHVRVLDFFVCQIALIQSQIHNCDSKRWVFSSFYCSVIIIVNVLDVRSGNLRANVLVVQFLFLKHFLWFQNWANSHTVSKPSKPQSMTDLTLPDSMSPKTDPHFYWKLSW